MKNKIFNLPLEFKTKSSEDGVLTIEGYANTTSKDRVGDIIIEEAWKKGGMDNFLKNPVILAFHDHHRPIGEVKDYYVDQRGLSITANISKAAGDVYELIKEGILKAFSVGFRVKDADYDVNSDIFVIKDLELFEVSVVSVPANADSLFSLKKSFNSSSEYEDFKKDYIINHDKEDFNMDANELKALVAEALASSKEEEAKVKAAELAKQKEEEQRQKEISAAVVAGTEALAEDMRKAAKATEEAWEAKLSEVEKQLAEKSEEINSILASQKNKMKFADKGTREEVSLDDKEKAFFISKALGIGFFDSKVGQGIEKAVNAGSSGVVSSETYETEVSTNLQRDVELALVVPQLFREIQLNAATQVLPINPASGYANWVDPADYGYAGGPGAVTVDSTGANISKTLTELTLKTYKLAGKSYVTDETEEDAIIAILPLLREQLVEAHAKALERAILRGAGSANDPTGLTTRAAANSANFVSAANGSAGAVAALELHKARRLMGKWGLNVRDLVTVVSQEAYWDLIEDENFKSMDLVGAAAQQITGQVGTMYGQSVVVSPEFEAAGVNKACAVIVNARNYVKPRLRGFSVQSDYDVEKQRRVIVATQRIGFDEIIPAGTGFSAVASVSYAAS